MMESPEILGLQLQPLRVPHGWSVVINNFYEVDPDESLEDRELVNITFAEVRDPWGDLLWRYFDSSYLWLAVQDGGECSIGLEWTPMADRNGRFVASVGNSVAVRFQQTPKRTIRRRHEGIELAYELQPPVTPSGEFERSFESRSRKEIVDTINQWLAEFSGYPL